MHKRKFISKWRYGYLFLVFCTIILNLKFALDSFLSGSLLQGLNSVVLILLFIYLAVLNMFVVNDKHRFAVYVGYGLASVALVGAVAVWVSG